MEPPRRPSQIFWDAAERQGSSSHSFYSQLAERLEVPFALEIVGVSAREVSPLFGAPACEFVATVRVRGARLAAPFRRSVRFCYRDLCLLHARLLLAHPWAYLRSGAPARLDLRPMGAAARAQTASAVCTDLRALACTHLDSPHVLAFTRSSRLELSPAHAPAELCGWAELQVQHNDGVLQRQPWRVSMRGGCTPGCLFQAYRAALTLLGFYALLGLLSLALQLLLGSSTDSVALKGALLVACALATLAPPVFCQHVILRPKKRRRGWQSALGVACFIVSTVGLRVHYAVATAAVRGSGDALPSGGGGGARRASVDGAPAAALRSDSMASDQPWRRDVQGSRRSPDRAPAPRMAPAAAAPAAPAPATPALFEPAPAARDGRAPAASAVSAASAWLVIEAFLLWSAMFVAPSYVLYWWMSRPSAYRRRWVELHGCALTACHTPADRSAELVFLFDHEFSVAPVDGTPTLELRNSTTELRLRLRSVSRRNAWFGAIRGAVRRGGRAMLSPPPLPRAPPVCARGDKGASAGAGGGNGFWARLVLGSAQGNAAAPRAKLERVALGNGGVRLDASDLAANGAHARVDLENGGVQGVSPAGHAPADSTVAVADAAARENAGGGAGDGASAGTGGGAGGGAGDGAGGGTGGGAGGGARVGAGNDAGNGAGGREHAHGSFAPERGPIDYDTSGGWEDGSDGGGSDGGESDGGGSDGEEIGEGSCSDDADEGEEAADERAAVGAAQRAGDRPARVRAVPRGVRVPTEAAWLVDGGAYFAAVHAAISGAQHTVLIADWWLTPTLFLLRPVDPAAAAEVGGDADGQPPPATETPPPAPAALDWPLSRLPARAALRARGAWPLGEHARSSSTLTSSLDDDDDDPARPSASHRSAAAGARLGRQRAVVDRSSRSAVESSGARAPSEDNASSLGASATSRSGSARTSCRAAADGGAAAAARARAAPALDGVAGTSSRLDVLLRERAESGVQIYVLIFKELSFALGMRSAWVKSTLKRLHRNVHVIRAPDFIARNLGRWSHHEKLLVIDGELAFVGGIDLAYGRYDTAAHALFDADQPHAFPNLDYHNQRLAPLGDVARARRDVLDRQSQPRMPWHDVACCFSGPAVADIAWHFAQRWNYAALVRNLRTPPLIPHERQKPRRARALLRDVLRATREPALAGGASARPLRARVQVLRSAGTWSCGCAHAEHSIARAYAVLIRRASRFIYIENQFFISAADGAPTADGPQNTVAHELLLRIRCAASCGEVLRVMVVLPLFPVAGGHADPERGGATVNCIMHQQFSTICRGGRSLLELLRADGLDPAQYICFFGLRTHAELMTAQFQTARELSEQVYVHSKLMIVDGRDALLGSANLNDRSLLGERDSEVNVLVTDAPRESRAARAARAGAGDAGGDERRRTFSSAADGGDGRDGFSSTLQAQLLTEHLDLARAPAHEAAAILADPASDTAWAAIRALAASNTAAFDAAIRCVPADDIATFAQLEALRQRRGASRSAAALSASAASVTASVTASIPASLHASLHALHVPSLGSVGPSRQSLGVPPSTSRAVSGALRRAPVSSEQAEACALELCDIDVRSGARTPRARDVESAESIGSGRSLAPAEAAVADRPHMLFPFVTLAAASPLEVDVGALARVRGRLCELPLRFLERERLQPEHPNSIMRELIETLQ
ncbi:hypothetical protein KFE25_008239 [Diacronema lutheri]|uniref:phospholipase D n=1 Tax=Diacronema lutheri TaxID=2081491 RepID=A0A8J5XS14_DIALT|nr:hypothetical protein KFE25_008239 [Diacronema lutheri]